MKRKMKKIVSLVLVFAMSIAIAVPGFAASSSKINNNLIGKDQNSPENSTASAQKLRQLESVKESLKDFPDTHVKLNDENIIEVYTDEVAAINAKAALSGGLVYGPWYGGADSEYHMSPSETVKILVVLTQAFTPFLTTKAIAVAAAESIASIIGNTMVVTPGQWVDVDRTKRYREVKYSDGTFAYFQTKVGASVTRSDTYLGYGETIFSGGLY